MHDAMLIKKLTDKVLYTRIAPYIKEYSLSESGWKVFKVVEEYFKAYPTKLCVNWDELAMLFYATYKVKADDVAIYTAFFKSVEECDPSSVVVEDVLSAYITKDYATQIMNVCVGVLNETGKSPLDDVADLVQTYQKEVGSAVDKETLFVSTDLSYIHEAVSSAGYSWRLEELNVSAGPLRDGDFVVVAARPETGKTTFTAAEVSNFASQLPDDTRPIIWVNNEESSPKVMARIVQSYFGVTTTELSDSIEMYNERYAKKVGKRILVVDDGADMNDVKKLTALFAECNPAMIVFDQLDKVEGWSREAREDLRIGKLYKWARDLAKKYGPVIAISQASEVADHVQYITQSMLRGSKTDKAAEADLILTIGRKAEDDGTRYIHVPKNKLYGGPRSVEEHRHGYFECRIRSDVARYEGVW